MKLIIIFHKYLLFWEFQCVSPLCKPNLRFGWSWVWILTVFYLMVDYFLDKVLGKILKARQFPYKMLKILAVWSVGLSFGQNFFKTFGSVWKIVGQFNRFFPRKKRIFVPYPSWTWACRWGGCRIPNSRRNARWWWPKPVSRSTFSSREDSSWTRGRLRR